MQGNPDTGVYSIASNCLGLAALPTLNLTLAGLTLPLQPQQYLLQVRYSSGNPYKSRAISMLIPVAYNQIQPCTSLLVDDQLFSMQGGQPWSVEDMTSLAPWTGSMAPNSIVLS